LIENLLGVQLYQMGRINSWLDPYTYSSGDGYHLTESLKAIGSGQLHWAGVPIGTDKTDTKTFYGAFCSAIEVIRKNNPDSKILVMTATRQCPMSGTTIRRKDTDKNKLGLTLEDYVNAQILACSELDVPVYDAYHTDYFKPYNPAFRKSSMPDGLHPNERGHEVIMYELIKNYYQFYG
ncbi:FtsW/RodA/SpoVE family cell cycle protein, partial [Salmonella enterica subsp. enterica serovar Indiana]|nr:FtsW/RodA/SpoVE family cell cycle protein [Salmonella enterica subsp. enterica serovar Indiana]